MAFVTCFGVTQKLNKLLSAGYNIGNSLFHLLAINLVPDATNMCNLQLYHATKKCYILRMFRQTDIKNHYLLAENKNVWSIKII